MAIQFGFIPVSEVSFGSIGATYAPFGALTPGPIQGICISSSLNQAVFLSTDGINDMIWINTSGLPLYFSLGDLSTDSPNGLEKKTQFYVRSDSTLPTSGKLVVMGSGRIPV